MGPGPAAHAACPEGARQSPESGPHWTDGPLLCTGPATWGQHSGALLETRGALECGF